MENYRDQRKKATKKRQRERKQAPSNVTKRLNNGVMVDAAGRCAYCHDKGCHVCDFLKAQGVFGCGAR